VRRWEGGWVGVKLVLWIADNNKKELTVLYSMLFHFNSKTLTYNQVLFEYFMDI
jgi:hypothetical protein